MRDSGPRVVLGIDPGVEGALAALTLSGELLQAGALPRHRKANDIAGTWRIFQEIDRRCEVVCCGIEFLTFGSKLIRHSGQLEGLAVAAGWDCQRVPAQVWQGGLPVPRGQKLKKERKRELARLAGERWPALEGLLVKEQGQADATWIADYTRVRWLASEHAPRP